SAQLTFVALASTLAMTTIPGDVAHAQFRLDASYTISIAHIPVGDLRTTADIGDHEYSISASARVSNAMQVLTSGEGSSVANGTIISGHLIPKSFASRSTF